MLLRNRIYYRVKPLIPRFVRLALRRRQVRQIRRNCGSVWPIDEAAGRKPEGWIGWPEGKQFAFVLTHDVESRRGLERVKPLAELEMSLGFRSCFNFIPEGDYKVPDELLSWLRERGFEIGVHDLHHDGQLFSSRDHFRKCAASINRYLKDWGAVGFRAGFMHRNLDWIHDLNIAYDSSTFDTDPFEPQPEGAGTIFPFRVQNPQSSSDLGLPPSSLVPRPSSLSKGYLELPYTLPQDSTLFIYCGEENTKIWREKLDWIARNGGMALLNVHPDYLAFGAERRGSEYSAAHYEEFLRHVKTTHGDSSWRALPRDVAECCLDLQSGRSPSAPKRVCMIAYSFYESDNRVMRYAKSLASRGDHVDVIALSRGEDSPDEEVLNGVHVHRVQGRERNEKGKLDYLWRIIRFLVSSSFVLTRSHLKQRYDVIHVHNVPDFLVFAAWLPRLTGSRILLDIHDLLPEFYASKFARNQGSLLVGVLRLVERFSCRFAHHVIISNHLWYNTISSRSVATTKCSVFINFVDTDVFRRQERRRSDGRKILIYPGGLQWHQGLDIAIRAFSEVLESLPTAEFHIYGEGPMKEELVSLAGSLGLDSKVRFFGSRSVDEIVDIVAQADLGVVAKRANSFGDQAYSTKIMEFMSLGVPVVVSKTTIDSYYFDDSVVRFFESGNESDLSLAILDVLSSKDLKARLIENACRFAADNSWERRKHDYFRLVDGFTTWTANPDEYGSRGLKRVAPEGLTPQQASPGKEASAEVSSPAA